MSRPLAAAVGVFSALAIALTLPVAASAADRTKDPKKDDVEFAPADEATLVPGVFLDTPPGSGRNCTTNFVFRSGDRVFLGTAAHCVDAVVPDGSPIFNTNGCVERTAPIGSRSAIWGTDGVVTEGTLAYSAWNTMQEIGEEDLGTCNFNDFALIELDPEDVAKVNPTVPLLGGPVALNTAGTDAGDPVFAYAPNITPETPTKRGFSLGDDLPSLTASESGVAGPLVPSNGRRHETATVPPGVSGDSGAPYLDGGGAAFGVLSVSFFDEAGNANGINGVTDLEFALGYANKHGDLGTVELVPGTEPFQPGEGLLLTPPQLPSLQGMLDGPRPATMRGTS